MHRCTECNIDVPAEARICPQCGHLFVDQMAPGEPLPTWWPLAILLVAAAFVAAVWLFVA